MGATSEEEHSDGRDRHTRANWSRVRRATRLAGRGEADRERRNAEAEERTDVVLRRLSSDDWTVVDNAGIGRGDAGHVVVGPAGVLLLLSRDPGGCVRVKDGVAWLRAGRDGRSEKAGNQTRSKAVDGARALKRQIRLRTGHDRSVEAVIVLWAEFPQRVAETRQVAYVHGRELASWLAGRPRRFGPGEYAEVTEVVRDPAGVRRASGVMRRAKSRTHGPRA